MPAAGVGPENLEFFLGAQVATLVQGPLIRGCKKIPIFGSVSDPYSFFTDPDPDPVDPDGCQYGSGSGSNPDPGL